MILTLPILAAAAMAQDQGSHGAIKSITLERQPCYGRCPVYKLTIDGEGNVRYFGRRLVSRMGDYKANVSPYVMEEFGPTLDRLGF